ncbi:hypothetical protein RJ639_042360 [Escallonia herrerae]|uniref:Uncharacterized protein n=1 Tax=Escallonia herrerae TaxID=1293975 RepID=A0AA88WJH5_9ASTE|nr:hypothetical protein RJ639_042360 [Escallonia herrerae]
MGEVKESWIISVHNELKHMADISTEMEQWKKRSIYRIPACVTDLNKKAYLPQAVSIGPYHYGQEHLKTMDDHKRRALLHFLKRSNKTLQYYVHSLAQVAQDLKDSYETLNPAWNLDTDAFLQLMILDGCFMLEILRTATGTLYDYAANDPIFSYHGKIYIMPYIKRDMLVLENQLPMLVLEKLVTLENEEAKHDQEFVNKLIFKFFFPLHIRASMGRCLHVLDVYRKGLLWEDLSNNSRRHKKHGLINQEGGESILSATQLNAAGIRLMKNKTGSLKNISFHGGILRLPAILVDDATESIFLNLLAFERFHVGAGNGVTSYISFMDCIIKNVRDVSLLDSQGIIQNAIGSDEAVATLFNSLSKDTRLDPESSLEAVQTKVNYYCKRPWNKWRAIVVDAYFNYPLAIVSVNAAIFLFTLTILQTIYTIYPVYSQNDSPRPSRLVVSPLPGPSSR